jgi:protein TonB
MEAKKKEHLKLEKNSGLYFVMGMTLILALVYTALEWKSFDTGLAHNRPDINKPDDLDPEIPPATFITPPPPPAKIIAPRIIEVVEDDKDIIESTIEATDPNQYTEILEPTDFTIENPIDDVEVTWVTIEEVPVFPGCEGSNDKRACFQEQMQKHIRKNFKYPENAIDMSLQGKVYLQFTILKDGNIGGLKMRGPHQILEDEAARIISKLPIMEPGKQRGQAVKVPFSIPITFKLQ